MFLLDSYLEAASVPRMPWVLGRPGQAGSTWVAEQSAAADV